MSTIKEHLITGTIVSLILLPYFGKHCLIILLFSVITDIDHVVMYWLNNGFTLNIVKIVKFIYKKPANIECKYKTRLLSLSIFHTIEFLIFIWFAAFLEGYYPIAIGVSIHLMMDYEGIIKQIYHTIDYISTKPKGRSISLFDWMIHTFFDIPKKNDRK